VTWFTDSGCCEFESRFDKCLRRIVISLGDTVAFKPVQNAMFMYHRVSMKRATVASGVGGTGVSPGHVQTPVSFSHGGSVRAALLGGGEE
jgi:hypothetical protein